MNLFFEKYINKNFIFDFVNSKTILMNSIHQESSEILNFIIDEMIKLYPVAIQSNSDLLTESIKYRRIEGSKKISSLIYQEKNDANFTNQFQLAVNANLTELVKYMIDNKYFVDFDIIADCISNCGIIEVEIISMIMNNVCTNIQKKIIKCISNITRI